MSISEHASSPFWFKFKSTQQRWNKLTVNPTVLTPQLILMNLQMVGSSLQLQLLHEGLQLGYRDIRIKLLYIVVDHLVWFITRCLTQCVAVALTGISDI